MNGCSEGSELSSAKATKHVNKAKQLCAERCCALFFISFFCLIFHFLLLRRMHPCSHCSFSLIDIGLFCQIGLVDISATQMKAGGIFHSHPHSGTVLVQRGYFTSEREAKDKLNLRADVGSGAT